MPYDQDLPRIAALAAARHDEFEVLRYTLEFIEDELPDATLDALVEEVTAPILAGIDCTTCANCCTTIDVYLTPPDAERLAEALQRPVDAVIADYIDRTSAAKVDEWGRFRSSPCAFLDGKLCQHYAHRPEACRAYPALTPDFRWTLADTLEGAGRCPIIYHVLDALCQRFDTAV